MQRRVCRTALRPHALARTGQPAAPTARVPRGTQVVRQGEADRRKRCVQRPCHVRDRRLKGIDGGGAQRGRKGHEPDHRCRQDHDARVRDDVRLHADDARKATVRGAGGNRTRRWSRRETGPHPFECDPVAFELFGAQPLSPPVAVAAAAVHQAAEVRQAVAAGRAGIDLAPAGCWSLAAARYRAAPHPTVPAASGPAVRP